MMKTIPHLVLSFFAYYIACDAVCPKLSNPDHGSVHYHAQGHLAFFICEHGYVLNGSVTTVCLFDKWSAEVPQCLPVSEDFKNTVVLEGRVNGTLCGSKEPFNDTSHGMALPQHISSTTTTAPKTHYTAESATREILYPQDTSPKRGLSRRAHTPWPSIVPTDVRHSTRINIGCEIPSFLPNGYVAISRKYPYRVQYMCARDVTLEGNHTAYCAHGRWSSPPPVCVPQQWSGQHPHAPQPTIGENPCLLDYDGCDHLCTSDGRRTVCQCHHGYTYHGKKCLSAGDPRNTSSNSCSLSGCSHGCAEIEGVETCSCPGGYSLDNDGKTCRDIDECLSDRGGCHDICINYEGSHKCDCRRGYKLRDDGRTCIQELLSPLPIQNPCSFNNGGCSQGCEDNNGAVRCYCWTGYTLSHDKRTCRKVSVSDPCTSNNGVRPCGDTCVNLGNGRHRCECHQSGTQLYRDRRSCVDINECDDNNFGCMHYCYNTIGSAFCKCRNGFKLDPDNKGCSDIDECSLQGTTRLCSGQCVNTVGSFHCISAASKPAIPTGNNGDETSHDPCFSNSGRGPCGDTCINIGNGQYRCECRQPGTQLHPDGRSCIALPTVTEKPDDENMSPGYEPTISTLEADLSTTPSTTPVPTPRPVPTCKDGFQHNVYGICVDIDECQQQRHGCSQICTNSPGSYLCKCENGYQLARDGRSCSDVNECHTGELSCSQRCINTQGSAYCTCDHGYTLVADDTACVDVDECVEQLHACDHGCVNAIGSYTCTCRTGFEFSTADGRSCTDINECLNNNGGCERECVNIPGGHFCTCPEGTRITSDLRSCVDVTCPALVEVANSRRKCSPEIEEGKFARVGTVCNIKCAKGYGSEGISRNECLENGTWSHALPSCSAKYCPPLEDPENGRVLPERCLNDTDNVVLSKCTYTCDEGFLLTGNIVNTCKRTGTWMHPPPICKRRRSEVSITCPSDVYAVLSRGSDSAEVDLPRPVSTNAEAHNIAVQPGYIKDYKAEFYFGSHVVTYVARDPTSGREANCTFVVEVLDKEPPSIVSCPASVHVYATRLEGAVVNWDEPEFEDNVDVDVVKKSKEPGTVFRVGEHFVHYVAYDTAGNHVTCEFAVIVQSKECGWLGEIENGNPDCNDWLLGVICEPYCDLGYGFPRNVPTAYTCNLTGIWDPRSWIPGCSPIKVTSSTSCTPGSEYFDELDDQASVCLECPPGMFWDAGTSTCFFCEKGFYQDTFGQTRCEPCPSSSTSATSQLIKEQCDV